MKGVGRTPRVSMRLPERPARTGMPAMETGLAVVLTAVTMTVAAWILWKTTIHTQMRHTATPLMHRARRTPALPGGSSLVCKAGRSLG
mmetsp:Transcript_15508/g.32810  ORF Transcript_15508/g.32810 Transcript_15508/m.32810 type:complete len:88 (-) Transcript_15508:303-566(-)